MYVVALPRRSAVIVRRMMIALRIVTSTTGWRSPCVGSLMNAIVCRLAKSSPLLFKECGGVRSKLVDALLPTAAGP